MIEKPKRHWKNVIEAKKSIGWRVYDNKKLADPSWWPCLECGGCGWVYDPHDPPDPVEGNKMRSKIKCSKCEGSGQGQRKELMKAYREQREEDNAEMDRYKKSIKRLKILLKRISENDLDLLSRYLSHYKYTS